LVNVFVEVVSLRDPSRRIFDDGAGMHKYLLCTILDCGSACNHVNRTKHMTDICRLSRVACCFSSFADIRSRRTGCDFLDLGDGVDLSASLGTRGGLCRM
jgi:hypothetical protein